MSTSADISVSPSPAPSESPSPKLRIGGLDAVVLISPNLEAQRDFYRDTLGLELVGDYHDAAFFKAGNQKLVIFGPNHHPQGTERLDGAAKGISHLEFAIAADEADEWDAHLRRAGHHVYGDKRGGNYQDADGNLFHFNLTSATDPTGSAA